MNRTITSILAGLALLSPSGPVTAQEKSPAAITPLKLDLVITRQAGDKKISNMPYTLWLTANAGDRLGSVNLRMGVSVPVPTTVIGSSSKDKEGEKTEPVRSFQYRDIGTNIDALANSVADGRFGVSITLNDSGLNSKGDAGSGGAPMLRNFQSRFYLVLKDGQTATYTSATDPATGETLKVDVTLAVLK